jgi:hypothetical protein
VGVFAYIFKKRFGTQKIVTWCNRHISLKYINLFSKSLDSKRERERAPWNKRTVLSEVEWEDMAL